MLTLGGNGTLLLMDLVAGGHPRPGCPAPAGLQHQREIRICQPSEGKAVPSASSSLGGEHDFQKLSLLF